ncbi:MAG: response regulator [Bacteroidota bacterium]
MPTRILAVDDELHFERLFLQRFRRKIKSGEYEFIFATSGSEALSILQNDPNIQMVLTDINMPEMDGLTLLGRIKELRPLLKTVIISAYSDMSNIRKAMNLGAFDFVTKPIDFPDLDITILKTLREVGLIEKGLKAEELEINNQQLQQVDQLRTRFFTNISHEFRTPLTVINGMAEQIEENPERWLLKGIKMIRRNGEGLLDLVNQILDLRKLQAGKLSLNFQRADVVSFANYLLEAFRYWAEAQDVALVLETSEPTIEMDFDAEKIQRILQNLISNALKFTDAGGKISLKILAAEPNVRFIVKDTGKGIAAEDLDTIFDRFFQSQDSEQDTIEKEGTGIGLALVNELVKVWDGRIEVESKLGEGSTFKVQLPRLQLGYPSANTVEALPKMYPLQSRSGIVMEPAETIDYTNDLPQLLIVEDNKDIVTYLESCLEGQYQLRIAHDGLEGVAAALAFIPDLIISDVSMPNLSGLELCEQLKTNPITSHIPIVLLTAKSDQVSKNEGLSKGADAYLGKPFNRKELLIRLEKLLELRATLQNRYQNPGALTQVPQESTQVEDEFILELYQEIKNNLDDEHFGIQELCRAIGMSRAQLHRKLKALTGLSASHFIRNFRLHQAKSLLFSTDLNISQIAFEVGFKDPKYFSRSFSEYYGESPQKMRSGGMQQ